MLSKCLWKMFSCDDSVRGNAQRISVDDLLDSLLDAIDTLPQRKDSRSDRYVVVAFLGTCSHIDRLFSQRKEAKLSWPPPWLVKSNLLKTRPDGNHTFWRYSGA